MISENQWVMGYIDKQTCADGENSHEFTEDFIVEDGEKVKIIHCKKCGYWY